MSPYLTEEGSTESGRPIELYRFTSGATISRYTSAAESISAAPPTEGAQTWLPVTGIERAALSLNVQDRGKQKSVTLAGDDPVVQLFNPIAPSEEPTVEIFRLHFGDVSDVRPIWRGEIVEVVWGVDTGTARVVARPPEGALDATIPRQDSGIVCPYMLYDPDCKVAEASFTFNGSVSSPTGNFITVSGLDVGTTGPGWATAGKVRVGNEVRVILAHVATDLLELGSPFRENVNGQSCAVLAGCSRLLNDGQGCEPKFTNRLNFGGNAFVPLKDIRRSGVK